MIRTAFFLLEQSTLNMSVKREKEKEMEKKGTKFLKCKNNNEH